MLSKIKQQPYFTSRSCQIIKNLCLTFSSKIFNCF